MEAPSPELLDPSLEGTRDKLVQRIESDPLTILRIATAIGMNRGQRPSSAVTEVCAEKLASLDAVDTRAVLEELEKCLVQRDVDVALQWLLEVGVMERFMPEVAATVDLAQEGGRRHKDVWEHTKLVVKQAVRRPVVRWAALLHDIGKVPTRTFTRKGVHFHGHAEVGARMFDKMARRLPFRRAMRRELRFLIKYHLRSAQYESSWTDSAVRRFHRELQEHLTDLLDLSRADITSRRPGRRRHLLHQIKELETRIERIVEEDARVPPLPTGLGNSIMEHFKLPPSKFIGDLKRALEAAVARGDLEERREDAYYLEWLAGSGLIPADESAKSASEPGAEDGRDRRSE